MITALMTGIILTILVRIPRMLIAVLLYLLSIISRVVGTIGSIIMFQWVTYLPVRIMLSPTEAKMLRDDFMEGMDGAVETLIEDHFGKSHSRELVARDLRTGLERGRFVETEKYDVGEFGVSLILTFLAIALVYFNVSQGLASALSLWIGLTSIILLFAVSTRTMIIDLLAYEEPSQNGSLVEDTKRLAWNGSFLSNLYPLTTILLLKYSKFGGPDLYRLTAHSLGVGLERAIARDQQMIEGFRSEFVSGFMDLLSGNELPPEIPSEEEFRYLAE